MFARLSIHYVFVLAGVLLIGYFLWFFLCFFFFFQETVFDIPFKLTIVLDKREIHITYIVGIH